MGGGARIVDNDRGYSALMKALEKAGKPLELTVGLHSEEAEGEAMEAAELNEFGSPGGMIPPRPAITGWADERGDDVPKEIGEQMKAAIAARKPPVERVDQLAQKYAAEIQANIASGIAPENSPVTIALKGSSIPLIDTGTFRSSIRGRVRSK